MDKKTIAETVDELAKIKKDKKEQKQKMPKEVKQEIIKKVFKNLLAAILIMIYFVILNLAYGVMRQERLINDIKVFAIIYLVIGIFMFEKAYKNESGKYAVRGIELLILSFHSLSIMHVITLFEYNFMLYLLTSSYIFSIYYVLKSIVIYFKERRNYIKSLSDISEIIKKEEPQKKEATKKNIEEENIEVEQPKKEQKKKQTKKTAEKKTTTKKKTEKTTTTKQSTKTTTKKATTKKSTGTSTKKVTKTKTETPKEKTTKTNKKKKEENIND